MTLETPYSPPLLDTPCLPKLVDEVPILNSIATEIGKQPSYLESTNASRLGIATNSSIKKNKSSGNETITNASPRPMKSLLFADEPFNGDQNPFMLYSVNDHANHRCI